MKYGPIESHRLSNGGWIPVKASVSMFYGKTKNQRLSYDVEVHKDTITVRPEDIPETLFALEFPADANVYNSIPEAKK